MSKKCKECRQPFEPRFSSLEKYCWNSDCKLIEALQKLEQKKKSESKEWSERKSKLKKDMLTVQDYLKLAQQVFNSFIRKRDEENNCISCSKPPKKANAGHYFNANNHWNVRFDERNVHLQCEYCNTHLHGNLLEYQPNLIKKIGHENYVLLCQEAYKTRKFSRDELKEIINIYKNKLK
jgi:hypothetical protein